MKSIRPPKQPNGNGRYRPFGRDLTAFCGRFDGFTVEQVGGRRKDEKGNPIFGHTLTRHP